MPENRSRFVLFCQQILVVGTVVAVAAPAVGIVTLDIVAPSPNTVTGAIADPALESLVASRPVTPAVTEVPVRGIEVAGLKALTAKTGAQENTSSPQLRLASADQQSNLELAALTAPEPVSGYATVGVTWEQGTVVDEEDITVSVRSLNDGEWSAWQAIKYDPEEGPSPNSSEGRAARPGTDPIIVGDVDKVQVKAETATGEAPADMQLAIIDPGVTTGPVVEQPAIDTTKLGSDGTATLSSAETTGTTETTDPVTTDPTTTDPVVTDPTTTDPATLVGNPADVTPKPQIFSRSQWGADEKMRDKSSLRYYEVHAGYVHHTVNANGYRRAQVPSLLRGIYAYHTQSKGWSDIGYNFIVDKFGRIWEGRFGGVARPVVGAHTLGYNEYSFAMSALGNFETVKPRSAMLDAYGRLFAWKLSLHGVDASSRSQQVGWRTFSAINGHRDAGQTACPGKYLYAKIPTIRSLAAGYQKPFGSRAKSTNISGSPWPDLVVRDKVSKRAYVIRTAGQVDFKRGRRAAVHWGRMDLVAAARDLTGDGIPDMVGRVARTGVTGIYPGTAQGTFDVPVTTTQRFSGADQLTGVLDMNGDNRNDLVARDAMSKRLYLYPGDDQGGFRHRKLLSADWGGYNLTTGVADMTGDGKNDLLARDGTGTLWLVPGDTARSLGSPVALPKKWNSYDLISGMGDVTNDGKPDFIARKRKSGLTFIYPGDNRGAVGRRYGPYTAFKRVDFLASSGQLVGNKRSDLVGRKRNGRLVAFANTGGKNIGRIIDTGAVFNDTNLVLNVGDWNGDGNGDVMTRSASTGAMYFRAGNGRRRFADPVLAGSRWGSIHAGSRWGSIHLITAVGDITGDGFPDLMGQRRRGPMRIYPGNGVSGFLASYAAHSAIKSDGQAGIGLWNSDGSPDSLLRRSDGSLMLYLGNGPGGLMNGSKIGSGAARYDWFQGVGDANGDGRPDVIARQRSTGTLWLLAGRRSGFERRRFIADGFDIFDLGG